MRLFSRSLFGFIFFIFAFTFFSKHSFAFTTPFRSANIITADGTVPYTNLNNCSVTDGLTCDRALAASTANLYFRDFGTYADFGMSQESIITKVRMRVTGKTSWAFYVGLSLQIPATSNCQSPSDLLTIGQLIGSVIKVHNFTADVTQSGIHAISLGCLRPSNFENNILTFRINYSTFPAWSANIDNFEIAFDYEPGSTPTPTPTPTPIPKTPLILIPGIGGSELRTTETTIWDQPDGHGGTFSHIYPAETVWVNNFEAGKPGNDDYFDILRMFDDGQTSMANLALTGNLVPEAYQSMINFFITNGYVLNQNLFVFPYDWRLDITSTLSLLDQKIQQIRQQTGSAKVDIVAHSMGGLVARNYISDSVNAQNVRKLFTIGTPHLGSVKFLKALQYGDCLFLEYGPFCLTIAPSEVKDVLQNMISAYELAPTQKYFDFYTGEDNEHPYPFANQSGKLNYSQIKSLLTTLSYNTVLLSPAEIFHNLDNNLENTNGVEIINVTGSGLPTLGQIIERESVDRTGKKVVKKDLVNINGDKTVPLFSASLNDPSKNLSLFDSAKVFYTNQEHGSLVASGSALNLVKNILNNNNQLPAGVSNQPYTFSGRLVSVHSPVNIHVYDSFGNHTGPTIDGDFEANIPGSSYDTLDDAKFIWLQDDGEYDIKFEATDQGSFDFKIKKYEDNINTSSILYNDISLTTSTKAQTLLDTFSDQLPVIEVDEDGNGTMDEEVELTTILTGEENYDLTPPSIATNILSGNQVYILNQSVTVDYSCSDENSGVDYCTGSISNGANLDTNSVGIKTFNIDAKDRAGNTASKTINYNVQYADNTNCLDSSGHIVLKPIDTDGTSVFKQGSTIPAKFRVCDVNGVSIGSPDLIKSFNLVKIISGTVVFNINELVNSTTPESNFHWDPINQQWIFNMSTKNLTFGNTYFYKIGLDDLTNIDFSFGLR